jgi:Ca2+-binding RTX toxin-like protein
MRTIFRLTSSAMGLAGLAALLASPAPAAAASVSAQAGVVTVSDAAGERNDVTLTVSGKSLRVGDTAAPLVAGAGCSRRGPDSVACSVEENSRVEVLVGDEDDVIVNDTELKSTLRGGNGDDSLVGGSNADRLVGDDGVDDMDGRAGNDRISTAGLYIDRVVCGPGDDVVLADASDIVADDCETVDRVDSPEPPQSGEPPAVVFPVFSPGACVVLYRGTDADDVAEGGVGGDTMLGFAGNDTLGGGPSDDCVFGHADVDELRGEDGNDFLSGGDSSDRLFGGDGDDVLGGDAGQDRLQGDADADTLASGGGSDLARGGGGGDRIHGGRGGDLLRGGAGRDVIEGGRGPDRVRAGSGTNRLSGGRGDDDLAARNGRADAIRCGPGTDTVRADRIDHVGRSCETVRRR